MENLCEENYKTGKTQSVLEQMENYPILEKWCFIITEITVLPMFLYKFNITSIKKYSPRIFFLEFKKLKLRLDLKSVCQLEQNCDLKKAVCWHPLKKLIHYHWASPTHFYLIYAMWNKDLGLLSHPVSKRAKKGHLQFGAVIIGLGDGADVKVYRLSSN